MKHPNIILICLHECRWDSLGFSGYAGARTANLNALAAHGLYYPQAVASSMNTDENRARLLGAGEASLAARARAAGYDTMAAGYFPGELEVGDFERVERCSPQPLETDALAIRSAFGAARSHHAETEHPVAQTGDHAVRLLRTASEPFFLAVSYPAPGVVLDPPSPWDRMFDAGGMALPDGFRLPARTGEEHSGFDFSLMTEPRFRKVLACYHGLLAFMDHQVGRLLATLASRGLGHTTIAVTAAGGHYLGQHGRTAREAAAAPWESLLRVPMILAGATGAAGVTVPHPSVTTESLHRALAALMAAEALPAEMTDTSEDRRNACVRLHPSAGVELARRADAKAWRRDGVLEGVYDLKADAFEERNLCGSEAGAALAAALFGNDA